VLDAGDGSTVLHAARAGRFALVSEERPGEVIENVVADAGAGAVCRR
jgi:hypothetical protein